MKRFAVAGFVVFFIFLTAFAEHKPTYSKFYLGLQLGAQDVAARTVTTAVERKLLPYNRVDIAERLSIGYFLRSHLVLEGGLTYFSGYTYRVQPINDTVHRELYSFDLLAKVVVPVKSFYGFVGGGMAVVYSNVNDFFIQFPPGLFNTDNFYRPALWGTGYFVRPTLSAGLSFAVTPRFLLGVAYSYIFAQGSFASQYRVVDGNPTLIMSQNSLPSIGFLSASVIIKV